jgi:hypothetical protein
MLSNSETVEQFVTLFDSNYLPMGVCLHQSLMQHAQAFHLWIVCMDDLAVTQLRELDLPHVTVLPIQECETPALLKVKAGRTRGEYCWTLTPFTPQFVFDRNPSVERVTYLDADLFFFDSPHVLLKEFEESGKDVLITPHAYAPNYDQSAISGKYCVQFMTFLRTAGGIEVMRWWQERCIEWCFARSEDGKFGDQKYLDDWPTRFPDWVHVLSRGEKTLAPWNVKFFMRTDIKKDVSQKPVFYHFHSLRLVSVNKILLYSGYKVGRGGWIYDQYLQILKRVLALMQTHCMAIPARPISRPGLHKLRTLKYFVLKSEKFVTI